MAQFTNYPNFNYAVTGVTSPSGLNTTFYYSNIDEDGNYEWADSTIVGAPNYIYESEGYWLLQFNGYDCFRVSSEGTTYPPVNGWEPYDGGDGAGEGTVVLSAIPFNKSSIIVSGVEIYDGYDLNGVYVLGAFTNDVYPEIDSGGLYQQRPVYLKTNESFDTDDWDWIYWSSTYWALYAGSYGNGPDVFDLNSNQYYPFGGEESWVNSGTFPEWGGTPILTPVASTPSQNTFGLPAESVALITSRFGSVANYLRLRNQGQI